MGEFGIVGNKQSKQSYWQQQQQKEALDKAKIVNQIDAKMGFPHSTEQAQLGYLVNMQQSIDTQGHEAVDFYFIREDGDKFKYTMPFPPYFYTSQPVEVPKDLLKSHRQIYKEDLDVNNHLLNKQTPYYQYVFSSMQNMQDAKKTVPRGLLREHDIPLVTRACIDQDIRVGLWYNVTQDGLNQQFDKVLPADPVVLAFDIETTKAPLKFPQVEVDQIMMISYMVDGQGYLITNREIVSEDIDDFQYSPSAEFQGEFIIFNEASEKELLERFFEHVRQVQPQIFVTYNGDYFDWPFIEKRALNYDIVMFEEIGFQKNDDGEYTSKYASHMDCLKWVKRDSYLPVGSQGLKAVTKYKLGYDPKELDPELMTPYAADCPQILADYSVSDAVATYYLYMKYVHPFIFSLCMIIPLSPDDVLRKGSGTLCEMLLMVEAYKANVIMPNKHRDDAGRMYDGHLLNSETYVGGHVEALESGVFRSDLTTQFRLVPEKLQELSDDLDRALKFSIEVEEQKSFDDIVNYDEVRDEILWKLQDLKNNPIRKETPLIYHLDVAAMYPNIILTNRLQPPAIVSEEQCAACDFYEPGANCQRKMTWSWRGEYYPADRSELAMIRTQLETELFKPRKEDQPWRKWHELSESEQQSFIQKRLSDYCRKVYHKVNESKVLEKESVVCQRENSFYVDTVRNFRDRRYEYKGKLKTWKRTLEEASDPTHIDEAKRMVVLMDSLQLAHKCILNSFYGYVMRKGSRWYSMEMAGIVCLTGANIIRMAREIVEQIGRPLELDTDGIWCILPSSFPETFTFTLKNGKSMKISYPCVMLNHLVHDKFTNEQYQTLVDPDTCTYETTSENSIFFEVDGPYRAMILPASKEENKLLKKRYAVFNDDGSLAELKGFEIKRRGELKIIKIFQEEVFKEFLVGETLAECYDAVAKVANRWLDILFTKGSTISDEELFEYISENRSMSKTLEEYGTQKSTSISTAKRLAEFLGDEMVKDQGLACKFIISHKPAGTPVTERAIPIAIFQAEPSIKRHFLRKWLHDQSLVDFDLRSILDWNYYVERVGGTIQKLITIPAANQSIPNPVPRIQHPDWLLKSEMKSDFRQNKITDVFKKVTLEEHKENLVADLEDFPARKPKKKATTPGSLQPDGLPSMFKDFSKFVAYQKIKWKLQLQRKKADPTLQLRPAVPGTINSFLKKPSTNYLRQCWQIISIAETTQIGEFQLWVMIGEDVLQPIKFTIPRVFYVNNRYPDPQERVAKVSKVLPRSQEPHYLFMMNLPERLYQEQDASYKMFSWHPDTLGVYETQVPLVVRALLRVGCITMLDRHQPQLFKKTLNDLFDLQDLMPKRVSSEDYLQPGLLDYSFIYHSVCDVREVLGLFIPSQSKAIISVLDPYKNNAMPNLGKIYSDRRHQQAGEYLQYPDELEYTVQYFSSSEKLIPFVQKALMELYRSKTRPLVIMVQTPQQINSLKSQLPGLKSFPVIPVQSSVSDNTYPPLDWQRFASRRMMQGFVDADMWMQDRMALARYANVPVADLESDAITFIMDLAFARYLSDRDLILWYSTSFRSDLGGREHDDNIYALKELVSPEINNANSYDTVCIEYSLQNLPVNAILQSGYINEMEGADQYAGLSKSEMLSMNEHMKKMKNQSDNYELGIDQNMPSFHAFKCLKDLVRSWAKEFLLHGSPVAELLLKNFYRWISSPQSKMYDASIYGYLHSLMTKTLTQLLTEFAKLGAKVIYASFERVVVVTTKTNVRNARAWSEFVVKALQRKDAFAVLELNEVAFWDQLLWMDVANYGGLICQTQQKIVSDLDFEDNPSYEEEDQYFMQWNLKQYLPKFIQHHFDIIVAQFIQTCKQLKEERRAQYPTGSTHSIMDAKDSDARADNLRKVIREVFAPKLLDIVSDIQATMNGVINDEDMYLVEFPKLPGCETQHSKSPSLEFIKSVCHVLSLCVDIQDEVRILKRSMLNLIGVREFSPEAEFSTVCESFILPHIVCSFCQYSRDIDLARDAQLGPEVWQCPECTQPHACEDIELLLAHMAHQAVMAYQLRDMKCKKCGDVKCEFLRDVCKICAGDFEVVYGRDSYLKQAPTVDPSVKKISMLKRLAVYYKFEYLSEILSDIH